MLVLSGANYTPRPILQSYAVLSSQLADINPRFFESSFAPDKLFFRVVSIDMRLPTVEDPITWLVLINRYEPGKTENGLLELKRRKQPSHIKLASISQGSLRFGETLGLSSFSSESPLWTRFDSSTPGSESWLVSSIRSHQ